MKYYIPETIKQDLIAGQFVIQLNKFNKRHYEVVISERGEIPEEHIFDSKKRAEKFWNEAVYQLIRMK